MSAFVEVDRDAELSTLTQEDALAAVEAAKVEINDEVTERIGAYLEAVRDPEGPPEGGYQIATGREPTDGEDGTFAWDDSLQNQASDWSEDGSIDFYNVSSIVTVEAGALVGRITLAQQGVDGVDVSGKSLPPKRQLCDVVLKDGVELGGDGRDVLASVAGKVVFKNNELFVHEIVEIAGDVDFEIGNLDLLIDCVIRGSIGDRFSVKTKANLTVGGVIEAAVVEAAGNVTVRGGILGRGMGRVEAGGELVAKFCDKVVLRAASDIRLGRETINSHIYTEGKLLLPQGAIIGGVVVARLGVEAGTLGSDACVPTEIIVGMHPGELQNVEAVRKENEKRMLVVEKIRRKVSPLMSQLERLTRAQRERVTEMMFQADTVAAEIASFEKGVVAMMQRSCDDYVYVLVNSTIHQRVSIRVGDRVVTFHKGMKGPVKIERRKIKNYTAIVSVNQLTGSVTELNAQRVALDPDPTGAGK